MTDMTTDNMTDTDEEFFMDLAGFRRAFPDFAENYSEDIVRAALAFVNEFGSADMDPDAVTNAYLGSTSYNEYETLLITAIEDDVFYGNVNYQWLNCIPDEMFDYIDADDMLYNIFESEGLVALTSDGTEFRYVMSLEHGTRIHFFDHTELF